MEQLLDKLIGLLANAMKLYQSLLREVQNEKDAVVGMNLEKLTEAGKAKYNLLLKLRILEEQRQQVMERLADHLGCSPQGLTLTKLSQRVDESYGHQLLDLSTDLLALIQALQEATQQNKLLMSHSLQLIQGSCTLLNNLMTVNPVYQRSGNMGGDSPNGRFLSGEF